MKLFKYLGIALAALLFSIEGGMAQIQTPAPSPSAKTMQTIGLSDFSIEYSRPATRGRVIFAQDGLVPFGEVWRTGANQATKITLSEAAEIGGTSLKAGSYAILSIPQADKWAVHFYTYESSNWTSYVKAEPVAIVQAKVNKLANMVESFQISFDNISSKGAELSFSWGNAQAVLPIKVEVDKKVMASIERVMAGPSQNDYFAAASYYHDSGKDLNKAMEMINKATEKDPKFWMVRRKSLILADMGKKSEAIKAAKLSLALAKEAGNKDYVRMNEKSIQEWSK